jgi:hypothetical protein
MKHIVDIYEALHDAGLCASQREFSRDLLARRFLHPFDRAKEGEA